MPADITEEMPSGLNRELVQKALDHAADLLPAQGPLSVFVHHNTLHAFEHLPFEQAVVEAGQLFGCEPFLSESRYRQELDAGRILWEDILDELNRDLGDRGANLIGPNLTRQDVQLALLKHPITVFEKNDVEWIISETDILEKFRNDLDSEVDKKLRTSIDPPVAEADAVRALWEACLRVSRITTEPRDRAHAPKRPRDFLLEQTGIDSDESVNPLLIRYTAAYLDQGVSYWPMRNRENGFYRCFLDLYEGNRGIGSPWLMRLGEIAAEELLSGLGPSESILRSLDALDIKARNLEEFVSQTLLAQRGWAGMVWEAESRPDRLPEEIIPARLVEYLAIRLLADRAAAEQLAHEHDIPLWARPGSTEGKADTESSGKSRACWFHQVAQILGLGASEITSMPLSAIQNLIAEAEAFSETDRRRIFHLAYERQHRTSVLAALQSHVADPATTPERPAYQAIFCIDDREESFRRHLEEVDPTTETLGYPGFFGAAFYYKSSDEKHATPLCPVIIRPDHELHEVAEDTHRDVAARRESSRRKLGRIARHFSVGTQTFSRGALFTSLFGILAVIPLLLRVTAPRFAAFLRRVGDRTLIPSVSTRLTVARDEDGKPSLGKWLGYTKEEMADIVQKCLDQTGLKGRLSELLIAVGHGSSSLNNPHESAYDCGACGGGKGGPNARAFALMANDPEVRDILRARGLAISGTQVVAAYHNTCNDNITWYDLGSIPDKLKPAFERARTAFDGARTRNAHERCRRFESADPTQSPEEAIRHAAARSEDLAEVRPEYNHATCSVFVVGRRNRTRGLFLDRRAFLNSYDPTIDSDGSILAGLLAAAAPVCAGISLEYYFSHVDSVGYGCGSKLPHNVTALLGVMDGHASDLRTGLSWQMVEIHEPVRLLMIVETTPAVMTALMDNNEDLARLIRNRWIQFAVLSPDTNEILVFDNGTFTAFVSEGTSLPTFASSIEWYREKPGHLPAARIGSRHVIDRAAD